MRKTAILVLALSLMGVRCFGSANSTPDPLLPVVEILATDPTGLTDTSSAAFTIVRTGPLDSDLVIKYTISGSAQNGVDYTTASGQKLSGTLTIPKDYGAADIIIVPRVNSNDRGNKTVTLTLEPSPSYRVGRAGNATVQLVDNAFGGQPPAVELAVSGGTLANDGTQWFVLPATVKMVVPAADLSSPIARVSFYANEESLGADSEPPFEFEWLNPRPGRYDLFARAVDSLGESALSGAVKIAVKSGAPTIKITSPSNASMPPGSDVEIAAEVRPGSGKIVRVEIYGDGQLLATRTAPPYEATWSSVPSGSHRITVRVVDEFGQTASSNAEFKAGNRPPMVRVISPKSGAVFNIPATIEVVAEVTDPEGNAIGPVSFYANGKQIGAVNQPPYKFVWSNVNFQFNSQAIGCVVQVSAADEFGAQAFSQPVKIKISK